MALAAFLPNWVFFSEFFFYFAKFENRFSGINDGGVVRAVGAGNLGAVGALVGFYLAIGDARGELKVGDVAAGLVGGGCGTRGAPVSML